MTWGCCSSPTARATRAGRCRSRIADACARGAACRSSWLPRVHDAAWSSRHRWRAAGCTHVDVVPLFLGAGGHVRATAALLAARGRTSACSGAAPAIGELEASSMRMARR
jgi:sirohydrochlorin ferrochelatase